MPTRPLSTRYAHDLALFRDRWQQFGLAAWTLVALGFPFLADDRWLTVGTLGLVSIVGALALMILTGFAGQISLGHAAFLAVGAYTTAILGEQLALPFWLCLPLSGCTAALVGLAVGPFALRLRGLYLALVTLGLVFLVNHTLLSMESLTHGVSGILVPMHGWFGGEPGLGGFRQPLTLGGLTVSGEQKLYLVFLVLAAAAILATKNLRRSPTGRAMLAVRDHDVAASVLGVNPAKTKIVAFGVSSFLAGIAGSMFALQQQYITVEPPFDLSMSIAYIAMCVIGGVGSVFGAVAGALAYVFLSPLAQEVGQHLPLVSQLSSAQQSTLLFSVLVIGFLLFDPLGLLGIWLRIKRYFLGWPFRY